MQHITIVAGARPNFVKIAPLVRALRDLQMRWRLVHTGQHYDRQMSQTFFAELAIPTPDVNFGIGSGSYVWQTTEVMRRLELELTEYPPSGVVVVGDVTSTLAAALTASKLAVPVAHIEAGLRSFDRAMPEEINRILTDAVSDVLYTSEPSADNNLVREGIPRERIRHVGNVMIDTLFAHLDQARERRAYRRHGLGARAYALLTLHRPSNVDSPHRLDSILRGVHKLCQHLPVLFPLHPRTARSLREFGFATREDRNSYVAVEPVGYLDMLSLTDGARLVLTDSGGLQEETTALRVPCLTLRENTERPITVEYGSNRLVGWDADQIIEAATEALDGPARKGGVPERWDGLSARRIASHLLNQFCRP